MKSLLSILFVLFLFFFSAGAAPVDSTRLRLERLEKQLKRDNDSLKRELQHFKVKEDYYANSVSDALSDQSNRFGLLITIALTIATLINFGFFKFELRRYKKKTSKEFQDVQRALSKQSEALASSYKAFAAQQFRDHLKEAFKQVDSDKPLDGIWNYLSALQYFTNISIIDKGRKKRETDDINISNIINLINIAIDMFISNRNSTDSDNDKILLSRIESLIKNEMTYNNLITFYSKNEIRDYLNLMERLKTMIADRKNSQSG